MGKEKSSSPYHQLVFESTTSHFKNRPDARTAHKYKVTSWGSRHRSIIRSRNRSALSIVDTTGWKAFMRENRRTVMFVGVLTTTVVLLLVVFVWGVTLYRQNTHSVHGESAAPLLSDSSIPSPTEVKMRWASFEDRYDERARVTAEKDREFTEFGWPAARVIPKDETNETHL